MGPQVNTSNENAASAEPAVPVEAYCVITEASMMLGFRGICPESLAALQGLRQFGFLNSEMRAGLAVVLADMERMFAPVA